MNQATRKQIHDIEQAKQRQEAIDRANKAYNKGLLDSLPYIHRLQYNLLKRP